MRQSKVPVLGVIALAALLADAPANQIEISASGGEGTFFVPSSVTCWAGDQLSFRNRTSAEHEPGVINKDGTFVGFLAGPLKPDAVSAVFSPPVSIDEKKQQQGYTLHYVCRLHKGEQGTIVVVPTP